VVSGVYNLPWQTQVSAIVAAGSGRPYNILAGADLNGDGDSNAVPGPDRARATPADQATSVSRNAGRLPAEHRVDLRLTRRVRLGARAAVIVSVDVLNAFNTTNFTAINNIFGRGSYPSQPLPAYGQFTQAAAPRQAQLGFRFVF
jgi:hypothetical protein